MTSHEITRILENLFPAGLAVEGDATGVQIDCGDREVVSIGIAYELTDRIVGEICSSGTGYVIVFHPLIYRPLGSISPEDRVGRAVLELVSAGVTLFVTHTRLDAHPDGTNTSLARALGAESGTPLVPLTAVELPDSSGMGRLASFANGISWSELIERVRQVTRSEGLRASPIASDRRIEKVAIVAGSGMSYYDAACRAGADVMITGDVRYHDFHAANDRIPIIDPGHAESEAFVLDATGTILNAGIMLPNMQVVRFATATTPLRYLPSGTTD